MPAFTRSRARASATRTPATGAPATRALAKSPTKAPSKAPATAPARARRGTPPTPPAARPALSPARAKVAAARRRGLRLKYVTRLEQPDRRTFGWQVRVVARGRVAASAFFADAAHGTAHRALAAALAFRDEAERELGVPVTRHVVHSVARSNTGVLGMHWSAHLNAYVATYPLGGRRYARELFPPEKETAKAHKAALAAATTARAAGVRAYHAA